ncbi:RHS repeat-associated core domain-containing protein [Pseudomonas sp. NFX15]|uniref:RHS repeat-associated core domain-containing protein n=1 Tax=Pseudomonas sp. NFX15 TaxID=2816958 RepID=UPI003B9E91AA
MPSNRETLLCRYHYDPLDRLVDCMPSAQPNAQRYYLKDRLATEIQGVMQRSIMQHDDQLLSQQQRQSGVVETRLLASDQQRSVLNVLDVARPHPLAYSPYGHRPAESGLLSMLGFNGERPDPVTGCYLLGNGYRAFNPVLMRFNSPDSWSPFGEGGLNAYAYCVGDPVNLCDPTGHLKLGNPIKGLLNLLKLRAPSAPKNISHISMTTTYKNPLANPQAAPLDPLNIGPSRFKHKATRQDVLSREVLSRDGAPLERKNIHDRTRPLPAKNQPNTKIEFSAKSKTQKQPMQKSEFLIIHITKDIENLSLTNKSIQNIRFIGNDNKVTWRIHNKLKQDLEEKRNFLTRLKN